MIGALTLRQIRLEVANAFSLCLPILFYVLFVAVCAIGLGGDPVKLTALGPAIIWLGLLFSLMLSLNDVFLTDFEDGSLEQLILAGQSKLSIAASKFLACIAARVLPLLIVTPIIGLMLGFSAASVTGSFVSIALGAPAITAYLIFVAAILAGRRNAAFLGVLISAPLLIPVLIFGVSAVDNFAQTGISAPEFQALTGLSFIAVAVGLPAAAAALSTNLE